MKKRNRIKKYYTEMLKHIQFKMWLNDLLNKGAYAIDKKGNIYFYKKS